MLCGFLRCNGGHVEIWINAMLLFIAGYWLGRWQSHHYRRDWRCRLGRKLQLLVVRNEMKGYRLKRKRPVLARWQKCLLGWLHGITPTFTRYTNFQPATLIGWQRRYVKHWWWMISNQGKRGVVGRPKLDASVVQIIVDIKAQNPSYGARRISAMVTEQLGMEVSASTVRNILKREKTKPKRPTKPNQRWKTFLDNHRGSMASMDFKVTFNWRGKPLYILNIISHARRKLVTSRATHNPSSDWVAQQIRNAFPFDEAPREMLMDHDSIFLPLVHKTLPNMGIKVIRSAVKCPWQNGAVERFNRTLTEELLNHIIPLGEQHLNRLLKQYQTFYNTARPHRANGGQSPILQATAANDVGFEPGTLRAEAIPWLGGLHHSYRRAA